MAGNKVAIRYIAKIQHFYIRDGRAPIPKNETTSRIMSKIRAKNTKPELLMRKMLSSVGIRGYRLHSKKFPGRPDIVFQKKKLAIFIHGCFWHGCLYCKLKLPKTHRMFWRNKILTNKLRDAQKIRELKKNSWQSIIIWACRLRAKRESGLILQRVRAAIE